METSSIEATEDVMAAVKVPLTRVRKAVAKAMTFSATVPQFAVERAIQTQAMFDLRKELAATISVGDLINAAIVRALVEHPRLNASWHDDHIIEFGHVNLGVAVAVLDGLVVPAITTAVALAIEGDRDMRNAGGDQGIEQAILVGRTQFGLAGGLFGLRREHCGEVDRGRRHRRREGGCNLGHGGLRRRGKGRSPPGTL